jgi:hypothetical protein
MKIGKYDIKDNPTIEDYLIGTDAENIDKTMNFRLSDLLQLLSAGTSAIVTMYADTDVIHYTGLSLKPRIIQVIDENGGQLSFARSMSAPWSVKVYGTGLMQNIEINIMY